MIQISVNQRLVCHLARGIQLGSNIPLARNELIYHQCLLFLLDYAHQINLDQLMPIQIIPKIHYDVSMIC